MTKKNIAADRDVDGLYANLHGRYGDSNARANGYVYDGYFRGEQRILFSLLEPDANVLVDVGCGSGLMMQPLIGEREQIVAIDFNAEACFAAKVRGLTVVRGDAFALPLADASVDEIVACQFFNTQSQESVQQFIAESARALRGGGRLVMVWRNGSAWVHRIATACFKPLERLRGLPSFPFVNHSIESVRDYSVAIGLTVEREAVSFPALGWCSDNIVSYRAKWIGASNICILRKLA